MSHILPELAFEVRNLGPIGLGTFTHKPLTIFCGPKSLSHKADISRSSMFCIPSFDEMTNLTPYFNHVIPAYAGIQTVSHSASQVEELYETGS